MNLWIVLTKVSFKGSQVLDEGIALRMAVPLTNPSPKSLISVNGSALDPRVGSDNKVKNNEVLLSHLLAAMLQIVFAGQHENPSEQQVALNPGQHPHPFGPRQHLLPSGHANPPTPTAVHGTGLWT